MLFRLLRLRLWVTVTVHTEIILVPRRMNLFIGLLKNFNKAKHHLACNQSYRG